MGREFQLWAHPARQALNVATISAEITRLSTTTVDVQFRVEAPRDAISLPNGTGQRRNGLWKATCFELFMAEPLTPAYREFNFSPGGDWAAYHFDAYRAGMRNEELLAPPAITTDFDGRCLILSAVLSLGHLDDDSMLNFAAVIDENGFGQSLWATSHAEQPDFHARHCFAEKLPSLARP